VGDSLAGAKVLFQPDPLKSATYETRKLRIALTKPGLTGVAIAFKAHNDVPDLGGRDRLHFLIKCHA
jgi:hypothetical protein